MDVIIKSTITKIILNCVFLTSMSYMIYEYRVKRLFMPHGRELKYALIWPPHSFPYDLFIHKEGQSVFIDNKCDYVNCYIVFNTSYFDDLTKYDAILFSVDKLPLVAAKPPSRRDPKQKYVLATLESTVHYYDKIRDPIFNNFFNWTWTYRLDSNILWRYIKIYEWSGREVGPSNYIYWHDFFLPTNDAVKEKLRTKRKAAMWMVSNCYTRSGRELYVGELEKELLKLNLTLDIFGKCNNRSCGSDKQCNKMIERDYYFYLSLENSFDEGYVTEKMLTAVQNYAVPIVLGGADYSKFLPPGSYIDARKLQADQLAKLMKGIINDFNIYQDYFKWTNHYKFRAAEGSEICNLCSALNNEHMMNKYSSYPNLTQWWYGKKKRVQDFLSPILMKNKQIQKTIENAIERKRLIKLVRSKYPFLVGWFDE